MKAALLILDMLNEFDFPEANQLIKSAERAALAISRLKKKLKKQGVPVIYVNDNFGKWKSDWTELYESCTQDQCPGRKIAELLRPDPDDYFVLKPKHSGFYSTPLEILLEDLGAKLLIICGVAGNICVYFTAHDAHMREYKIWVPADAVASNSAADNLHALRQMKKTMGISTARSTSVGPMSQKRA